MGWDKVAPTFKPIAVIPKPILAKLVPKISAGNADTTGGIIAAVMPRARMEATNAKLEVNANDTNDKVIKKAPAIAKGLRLPILSDK